MKTIVHLFILGLILCNLSGTPLAAQNVPPKKLLVVSTSTRNRFAESIDAAEKALVRIADQTHAFTIDFVRQPTAPQPRKPKPPAALKPNASADEQAAFAKAQADYQAANAAYPVAEKKFEDEMKQALQKLSPESLKNYDAVVFCYTSGDLPLPDKDAFMAWIKAGHGFIGLGNAFETMVSYPPYYNMLGFGTDALNASAKSDPGNKTPSAHYQTANASWSHFTGTQAWTEIEVLNQDPKNPVNKGIPARWPIQAYTHKVLNFVLSDPTHTQVLLAIDKNPIDGTPGHFPIAWCHEYGQGRVFFTSLDNQDLWTEDATMGRKNPSEISRLFLAHLQGGVLWALGVDSGTKGQVRSAPPSIGAK